MPWTTSDLLTLIRLIARLRPEDPDYTTANLLRLADDLIATRFSGAVAGARQGYWLATEDSPITEGQADYWLPRRALADALVDVHVVDDAGVAHELTGPLTDKELATYATVTSGTPAAFGLYGNAVRLSPTPSATQGTLRMRYHLRRSKLVPVESAARIIGFAPITHEISTTGLPATWSTSEQYDLVQAEPGFSTLAVDQLASNVDLTTDVITFTSALPADLAVRDYVTLRWQTPIVQLPDEMHGALANLVASHVLAQTGDRTGAQSLEEQGSTQLDEAEDLLQPRVASRPAVIRHQGLLRRGRWLP